MSRRERRRRTPGFLIRGRGTPSPVAQPLPLDHPSKCNKKLNSAQQMPIREDEKSPHTDNKLTIDHSLFEGMYPDIYLVNGIRPDDEITENCIHQPLDQKLEINTTQQGESITIDRFALWTLSTEAPNLVL